MSFVIASITPADRAEHKLDEFDAKQPMSNARFDWAIDVDRGVFLRVLRTYARKSEAGDPDAVHEVDYHLRWESNDFIFAVRHVRDGLTDLPGTIYSEGVQEPGIPDYLVYLRHITLPNNRSALRKVYVRAVIDIFLEAIKASQGGISLLTAERRPSASSNVLLKLAPAVGKV